MLCPTTINRLRPEECSRMVEPDAAGFDQGSPRCTYLYSGSRSRPQICPRFREFFQARGLQERRADRKALRPHNRAEYDRHSHGTQAVFQTWIYARPLDVGSSHRIPYFDSLRGLAATGREHSIEYRAGADHRLGGDSPVVTNSTLRAV